MLLGRRRRACVIGSGGGGGEAVLLYCVKALTVSSLIYSHNVTALISLHYSSVVQEHQEKHCFTSFYC